MLLEVVDYTIIFCSQLLLGDAEAVLVLDPGVDLAG